MMNARQEQEFEDIIQRAISEAEKVECTLQEFAEGLKNMSISLYERMNMAYEEARDEDDDQ